MIPSHRGIGWNWQIKHIPEDPEKELPKWKYVRHQLWKACLAYAWSTIMLTILGFASAWETKLLHMQVIRRFVVNAIIGWSGAIWVLSRLLCFYSFCAALTVALGVYEQWQWPPLVGDLKDAWSVRRFWSVVYHQTMRIVSRLDFDISLTVSSAVCIWCRG